MSNPRDRVAEKCGLCGQPGADLNGRPFFGGTATGDNGDTVQLHHGTDDQIIGWHYRADQSIPILTTCYRAWTIYGHRPEGVLHERRRVDSWSLDED